MAKAKYAIVTDGNVESIAADDLKAAKQAFVAACGQAGANVSEVELVLTRTVAKASRGFVVARAPRKPRDPNAPKRVRKVAGTATHAAPTGPRR